MKIFIEGTPLFSNTRTGVGQYTKRLTEAMRRNQPQNEYVIFGFNFLLKKRRPQIDGLDENFTLKYIRLLPGRGYNLLYKKGLKIPIDILLRSRPDIVFFGNFALWPLWTKAKSVIVVHDLCYEDHGEYVERKNRLFLQKQMPYSINKSDHIFTVSEFSKSRIVALYGTSPQKISVIPPSVDHAIYYPKKEREITAVKKKLKLPPRYILFVSTLEPRKNIVRLLDAYAGLPPETQESYPLVLVGGKGWADEEIHERLIRYKNLPIVRPGYVLDEDMPALYSGATLFVFPTIYEGFGMPPLEAMACGTPVITSATSSLPEVVGNAAYEIDPMDTNAIRNAMELLLKNPDKLKELSKLGIARAKNFNWDSSAQLALSVFEKLRK